MQTGDSPSGSAVGPEQTLPTRQPFHEAELMHFNKVRRSILALMLCAVATSAWALDGSVPGINGDLSRNLLGDGTGVIVGIIDSGIDDTHPALTGLDSLGNPRLVAESNFVTTEPGNTGDDVAGHGTWVASAVLGRDATFSGMAPDSRYINARVLNNSNSFPNDTPVRNGIGYAIDQGADILNLSLNFFSANSSGNSQLDLMVDWAAYAQGIITTIAAGNISGGDGTNAVRGPGSAFNGIAAGRTIADFSKVSIDSAGAFTADGRMKPDVVAPGTLLTLANDDWEGAANDWDHSLNGTSFAAPHVAGLLAQILEAGTTHSLSTNPLVVKAAVLNSAHKSVLDRDFNPWEPANITEIAGVATATQPLDTH
jgi:serine protease AprX